MWLYLVTNIDKRIGKCVWEFLYSGILHLDLQKENLILSL